MKKILLTFAALCVVVSGCTQMQSSSSAPSSLAASLNTTPPPPDGKGCTPGYWKQEQHFDSWTAPYTPSTLFDDVFANAFPGQTLLQVVSNGGGGLNAAGRHAVASLLSGAAGFGLPTSDVVSLFNNYYNTELVEDLKNYFESWNELGCPLN
jgi:hypothetical protein